MRLQGLLLFSKRVYIEQKVTYEKILAFMNWLYYELNIRILDQQKGLPFDIVLTSIVGRPTLNFFQRHVWRQNVLNLKGSARRRNVIFWSKFLKNCKTTAFSTFFCKCACGAKSFVKMDSF